MVDRSQPSDATETEETVSPPAAPRRPSGGYRSTDARDTVAEMAARAQEISMEAGSKVAAAMKDVINAAAGLTGFALESARDLVQYMIRRGQMTPEEGEKLLREAEDAYGRRSGAVPAMPARGAQVKAAGTKAPGTTAPRPEARKAPAANSGKRPAQKAASKASSKSATRARAKAPPARAKAAAKSRPATKKKR